MFEVIIKSLLPALMIIGAATDVTSFRIPNWLTATTAALFVPVALYAGMPLAEFGWHVLMGLGLFFAGYVLFALRFFGGGDAKLLAAAGLWFGFGQTLPFLAYTVLAGGVLALVVLAMTVLHIQFDVTGSSLRDGIRKITPRVPYGFALAVGAILATPGAWWMSPPGL
jgi:prepilin peptidase CpaA